MLIYTSLAGESEGWMDLGIEILREYEVGTRTFFVYVVFNMT